MIFTDVWHRSGKVTRVRVRGLNAKSDPALATNSESKVLLQFPFLSLTTHGRGYCPAAPCLVVIICLCLCVPKTPTPSLTLGIGFIFLSHEVGAGSYLPLCSLPTYNLCGYSRCWRGESINLVTIVHYI